MVQEMVKLCIPNVPALLRGRGLFHSALFLKELCRNPRSIGAICPSSRDLAQRIARHIPSGDGLVVELGAGTGIVTQALANALVSSPKRLWAVEWSRDLAKVLSRKLPSVHVVQGDARELVHILPEGRKVDVIVSCLPLRVFSEEDVASVMQQWRTVLSPQGCVVQFTYEFWRADRLRRYGFYEVGHDIVWKNVPPARVQVLKNILHD